MPPLTTLGAFPYFPVEFDRNGAPVTPSQIAALATALAPTGASTAITDLFVISHGWNNDMPEAEELYVKIFGAVSSVLGQSNAACDNVNARRAAVLGVLWPSKKFDDASLIPGGAASFTNAADASAAANADLATALDTLATLIGSDDAVQSLAHARTIVPRLASSLDSRDEFVRIVRAFMPHGANEEEAVIPEDLFTLNGDQLLQRLSRPSHDGTAGGGGGAAGFTDWVGKAVDGAKSLVNLVTYYQMKNRAGDIGKGGVHDVLRRVRDSRPSSGDGALRLHLIGHSFGGRLVTAAAAGPPGSEPLPVSSLTLLQAAFSHFGFAQAYDGTHDGLFRRVVMEPVRVEGPVIITFTAKDKAVGLAYPIASRIARQVASAFGDANDPYGGIGRNGAQKTPGAQVVTLGQVGVPYAFAPRGVYNLDANAVIGGHSDLGHEEVGWAIVSAVAVT